MKSVLPPNSHSPPSQIPNHQPQFFVLMKLLVYAEILFVWFFEIIFYKSSGVFVTSWFYKKQKKFHDRGNMKNYLFTKVTCLLSSVFLILPNRFCCFAATFFKTFTVNKKLHEGALGEAHPFVPSLLFRIFKEIHLQIESYYHPDGSRLVTCALFGDIFMKFFI